MLFNSIDFAFFLPVVFALYWLLNNQLRLQNLLIVAASYVFYGWWDWRFLSLILFSTLVDYSIGLGLQKSRGKRQRKLLLISSLITNLGLLGFFKYYNFFLENFTLAFSFVGQAFSADALQIVLPVGISFYTFQTLSYTIDVYREKLTPTKDFVAFAAFVSFFPQLVAGPIERATRLLPQFYVKRIFKYDTAVVGMRQILWGMFKKVVIADNCAVFVDLIFGNSDAYGGSTLLLGAFFFAMQIYCDFSGYSDIAIGVARLFGFDLMKNFAFPYFSRDIAEFWRRWHISLSTWFRDYLYIPLGGSQVSRIKQVRNVFVIFVVSGFWHGANWTFIVWGALNAVYFLPLLLAKRNRRNLEIVALDRALPTLSEFVQLSTTFLLTVLAWVFFRADSIGDAMNYLSGIFSISVFSIPDFKGVENAFVTLLLVVFFIAIEWVGRRNAFATERLMEKRHRTLRWGFYGFLLFLMGMYAQTEETPFIYFQF